MKTWIENLKRFWFVLLMATLFVALLVMIAVS